MEDARDRTGFLLAEIERLAVGPLRLMEVCGTHTVAIFRAGIRQLLPDGVELVSGPGCPVCVTADDYIDEAVAYAQQKDVILTTFGDMLKVPGTASSLAQVQAEGADIRVLYSPLESLATARENPAKKVVFLAVGFETTAPTAAATVLEAAAQQIDNFFVLTAHKLVPPALRALLADPQVRVDGFILPGHVCAVAGEAPYHFLSEQYHMPAVIAGFEPMDILQTVYCLVRQIHHQQPVLENTYRRVVRPEGNPAARQIMNKVYEVCDAEWRGIGPLANSGLRVRPAYRRFDARAAISLTVSKPRGNSRCRCGEVLRGIINPRECPLFGKGCSPRHPVGACMVSVEGACAAWYKYGSGRYMYGR